MFHLLGSHGSDISDFIARSPTPTSASEWSEGEEEYTDDDGSYAQRPEPDSRDRFGVQFMGGIAALTAQLVALYLLTTRGSV